MLAHLLIPLYVSAALQSSLDSIVRRKSLANGLEVIVVRNAAVPLATALVAVRNGAFTQDSGDAGLAHLYEHLLFHAFRNSPDAFAIETTKLKGASNGETSAEVVDYYVMVPSENVVPAIGLLADLVMKARFSNGDLKAERNVVLDELQRRISDPEGDLERQVQRALWGSAWHRKDVGGDSASLQGISLDRLRATYARYYVPNNAALIVTGDVDPERIFTVAEDKFGGWKSAPNPFADLPIPIIPPLARTTAVMVARDVLDVTIVVALDGPSVGTDPGATYAADVLFDVFNDPSSAFQRRLVTFGPFESVSGEYLTLNHTGPIEFRGKTTPENAKKALLALIGELQNLDLLDGVTDDDLAIARKRRQVAGALSRERTASLAPGIAFWWSATGMDYYLTYHERMATQTADSLRRFARTYMVNTPRVIGVLAAPDVAAAMGDWLRQGARSP
jgi:zinc protease